MPNLKYGTVIDRLREGTEAYSKFGERILPPPPPPPLPPEPPVEEPSFWEKMFMPFSPKVQAWNRRQMPSGFPSDKVTAPEATPNFPNVPSEPTDLTNIPEGRRHAQQFDESGNPINPPQVRPPFSAEAFLQDLASGIHGSLIIPSKVTGEKAAQESAFAQRQSGTIGQSIPKESQYKIGPYKRPGIFEGPEVNAFLSMFGLGPTPNMAQKEAERELAALNEWYLGITSKFMGLPGVKQVASVIKPVMDYMTSEQMQTAMMVNPIAMGGASLGMVKKIGFIEKTWDSLPIAKRVEMASNAGLEGKVGSKVWKDLTGDERALLGQTKTEVAKAEQAIPKAAPGMPEAGLQPSMIPEQVASKEVHPQPKGKIVQESMTDALKLQEYQQKMELAGLKEWLGNEPATPLSNLAKKVGWNKGEITDLTLKQYRDLTGKTEIKPTILTKDGKHVRWEYALDESATELGYADSQSLKDAIDQVMNTKTRIAQLEAEIRVPLSERITAKPITPSAAIQGQGVEASLVKEVPEKVIAYHGTNADFQTFDIGQSKKWGKFGLWFTTDKELATSWGGKIKQATISLSNPKHLTDTEWYDIQMAHAKDAEWFGTWKSQLQKEGYDGLSIDVPASKVTPASKTIAAFDNKQVVSGAEVPPVAGKGIVPPAEPPKPPVAKMPEPPMNPEDAKLTEQLLSDYLADPSTQKAWDLQKRLLAPERAARFEAYRTSVPDLMAKGNSLEDALNIAKREMAGKYPVLRTEFFDELSQSMKDVYLNKVYNALKNEPDELLSTVQALFNALEGRPIPTKLGTGSRAFPEGGSALLRLQRVFGDQPQIMKQLETMAKEKKPLRDVVEGIFREIPTEPIPVDQAMADYLRSLPTIGKKIDLGIAEPLLQTQQKPLVLLKAGEPIKTSFLSKKEADQATLNLILELAGEPKGATQIAVAPDKYIKQFSMLPPSNRALVLKALKDFGWNAVDALGIPKAVKFAFDFSMMFRQLGISGPRHPVGWLKSWKPYFQAMRSDEVALKLDSMIRTEPERMNAIHKLGLNPYDAASGASYWDRPETMTSKLAERYIPGIRMSNRGAAVAVNYYMTEVGKQAVKVLDKMGAGAEEYKAMGSLINELVGRGEMPNILKGTMGDVLNKLMSSPRFTASRFEWPTKLVSGSKHVRQEAWSTLLAWAGLNTSILTMGYLSGVARVEGDPRSSDVLKLRIGNKHIDLWAGSQQIIRMAAQLAPYVDEEGNIDWTQGSRKTVTGKVIPVSRADVLARFAQSKESPGIGAIVSILTGKNYVGEKIDFTTWKGLGRFVKDVFAPASLEEIGDAYALEGTVSAAVSAIGLGGVGVSTYGNTIETKWQDEGVFKKYLDIPTDPLVRKEKKVFISRDQYREKNPDVDAKLFITGQVQSVQSIKAYSEVLKLIKDNGIDPMTIKVVQSWSPEENARRLKAGFHDTLTDKLIKELLGKQSVSPSKSQPFPGRLPGK